MSERKEYKLGEVTSLIGDGLHGTPCYDDNGEYYFINGNNLKDGKVVIKADTKRVNYAEYKKYRKNLSCNTILLSINGTIGNVAYYNGEKCMLGKSACYINVNDKICKNFLYYIFRGDYFQDYLQNIATGTTIPNVPLRGLRECPIFLPSLAEQKRIAEILSSLDDKIDLLNRQNRTLESMAETLFRKWFIDDADPEWEEGKLDTEIEIVMGQSPAGTSYNENKLGTPLFQGNADFGFRFPTNRIYTSEPKKMAKKFDTLISVRAPVGEQNMSEEDCCIGRGVAAFRYKKDCTKHSYVYYKMKSLMSEITQFNDTGTIFGSISKSDFAKIDVVIPDCDSVSNFSTEVCALDSKIYNNTLQIKSLTKLRDTLLSKLMSNEIIKI